ncbi:hypothetical protein KEM48_006794 [Puccinia striiformis f. sp. tritici PST-130]|nr:hypothetical protein KEM48_006794 [Puccinia striiformis f. sp. tritici PST-130]
MTGANRQTPIGHQVKLKDSGAAIPQEFRGRIRDCSKEVFLQTNVEVYGPGMTDMLLLTMAMQKLHVQLADFQSKHFLPCLSSNARVFQSMVTLVHNIQTHVWCLIGAKLLKGVLNSEGDIAPGLVLPRLNEITQVIFRFLSPDKAGMSKKEAQKKITILFTG